MLMTLLLLIVGVALLFFTKIGRTTMLLFAYMISTFATGWLGVIILCVLIKFLFKG